MTGNQLVAANLRRIRRSQHLTQTEAGKLVEPYLGKRWSYASWSSAERSAYPGGRPRRFDADEIVAFAKAFNVPALSFFLPTNLPEREET